MTPNTPEVGVTTTRDFFWRKFQAKARRMSYPALIVWEPQKFIHIQKKNHVTFNFVEILVWKAKKRSENTKKKIGRTRGEGCASDAYKATHPKILHGHSPPNLGARRTPIRPLFRKIEEKARVERL